MLGRLAPASERRPGGEVENRRGPGTRRLRPGPARETRTATAVTAAAISMPSSASVIIERRASTTAPLAVTMFLQRHRRMIDKLRRLRALQVMAVQPVLEGRQLDKGEAADGVLNRQKDRVLPTRRPRRRSRTRSPPRRGPRGRGSGRPSGPGGFACGEHQPDQGENQGDGQHLQQRRKSHQKQQPGALDARAPPERKKLFEWSGSPGGKAVFKRLDQRQHRQLVRKKAAWDLGG